jgi:hypothetical protein
MLLKLLGAASLLAGVAFGVIGWMTGDMWSMLPLTINGILGFAVLNALADIVDHLADINSKSSK